MKYLLLFFVILTSTSCSFKSNNDQTDSTNLKNTLNSFLKLEGNLQLNVDMYDGEGIELTWNALPTANNYDIFINNIFIKTTSTTNYFIKSSELIKGDEYSFQVQAHDSSDYSDPSNLVTVKYQSEDETNKGPVQTVLPPKYVNVIKATADEIQITWSTITDADHYELYVNDEFAQDVNGNWVSYRSISPGQTYKVQIKTVLSSGLKSDFSKAVEASIADSEIDNTPVPAPTAPEEIPNALLELKVTYNSTSEIKTEWEPIQNTTIKGYELYKNNAYKIYIENNKPTSYSDTDVKAGTTYKYKIRGHYYNGEVTEFSPEISVTSLTTEVPTDTNVLADAASPKEVIIDGETFTLAFSDEFNSQKIDQNKWNTRKLWGPDITINNEKQYYVDPLDSKHEKYNYNPFIFNGSDVSIRATVTPDNLKAETKNLPYMSGVLTTRNKFDTKYGYFEINAKIPSANGAFPAFWLLHSKLRNQDTKRFEIDIFENLGHRPDLIYTTVHHYLNVNEYYEGWHVPEHRPTVNYNNLPFTHLGRDFSTQFHRYAVKWEPGKITWFIDGYKVNELTRDELKDDQDAIDHEEAYIIVNLAMGGTWVNTLAWGGLGYDFPNNEDLIKHLVTPPELKVDYIRAYKKK